MLLNKLEDIEHARLRAVVQVMVDDSKGKEKGIEAFEDYMKIAFPYLEGRKKREKEDARKSLMSWVNEGPMRVTPMQQEQRVKSRLKQRVVASMASKEQQERHADVVSAWNKRKQER